MNDKPPVAIAVSPTGARRTRTDHPALPLTPAEIAQAARLCLDAGACMLHLHVRKHDLTHSLEVEDYRPAVNALHQAIGSRMVVQITTESLGQYSPARQIDLVKTLRPEAVSIAVRELLATEDNIMMAAPFLAWMHREHVVPQYILYSPADVERYFSLRKRGVIPGDRHWSLFVLGRHEAGGLSQPTDLLPFLGAWTTTSVPWAACAFGKNEAACTTAALTLGGHVRVGFENNLWLPNGTLAPGNQDLVAVVAQSARLLDYSLATADDVRGWFA